MSNQFEPTSTAGDAPVSSKSVKTRSLHVPMPAVLIGLGMLSGGAHAATTYQDVYQTPVNTPLSGVNVFSADAANSPAAVSCTAPVHGNANVTPVGDLFYSPPSPINATAFVGIDTFSCTGTDANGPISANVQVFVGLAIPTPALPAVSPVALGGLAAVLAFFGLRRRRNPA